uniref:unspecific monooxygenase n=1 Tax=Spodoptera frugiperda TaxID=7108 RepID=A0A2H1VU17_SPOFR
MIFLYLLLVVLVLIFLFYYVVSLKHNYWKARNVRYAKPTFLLGNFTDTYLDKKFNGEIIDEICKQFPDEKYVGAFNGTKPVLIPKDPEIIKLIVTKDFYYFHGRALSEYNHKEPGGLNLFGTFGDNWRVIRQNMTPLFTSAKMRNMFHLIEKCCHEYEAMIDREIKISKEHDVMPMTTRFTMDCIGACAFGIDTKTMTEGEDDNPFRRIIRSSKPKKSVIYQAMLRSLWPEIYYALGFKMPSTQMDFLHKLITSVMNQRDNKPSDRNDFVDLIMGWKQKHHIVGDSIRNMKTGENEKVVLEASDELLIAQCYVFFAAGFKTSTTALSYTLYEIAKHEDVQNKVFKEIDSYLARHDNKINYDCVSELPYLDAVIDETFRVYPVLSVIPRELMEDYTMPDGTKLDKGLSVQLPVYHLHHNPKFHPEPEVFRPDRFLGEEKKNINPYVYLPFGEGPRVCIGMRFAKMQMLAGLITMLKKYRLELADGMPTKLKFKAQSFITHPVGGIRIKFIEREGWESRVFAKDS